MLGDSGTRSPVSLIPPHKVLPIQLTFRRRVLGWGVVRRFRPAVICLCCRGGSFAAFVGLFAITSASSYLSAGTGHTHTAPMTAETSGVSCFIFPWEPAATGL